MSFEELEIDKLMHQLVLTCHPDTKLDNNGYHWLNCITMNGCTILTARCLFCNKIIQYSDHDKHGKEHIKEYKLFL